MWPWGKFAQHCSSSSCNSGYRQLVGCLNERSNEHRNECAPHDKYVKFLLKLSSICCQFLTTSATNFVLVRVSTQLNEFFLLLLCRCASFLSFAQQRLAAAVFPWHLQQQHSQISQLSALGYPCLRPSPALAHFKLLTQKLILASGCCQPKPAAEAAAEARSQLLSLPGAALTLSICHSPSHIPCLAVHLVAFHSFADCNISLPLRFVCCILSSVAEVCLN